MLNKEKYAKEILDIACEGWVLAIDKQHNNNPISCTILSCDKCAFNEPSRDCRTLRKEWCEQEYVEPPVDWTKVAVDTPILVSDNGKNWHKRHFAKFEGGKVYAWKHGKTSWTHWTHDGVLWEYAKLAESEE